MSEGVCLQYFHGGDLLCLGDAKRNVKFKGTVSWLWFVYVHDDGNMGVCTCAIHTNRFYEARIDLRSRGVNPTIDLLQISPDVWF